jgi:oligoendopeptidase F
LAKRHQVSLNAGFEKTIRDYKFADLGRFEYKKEDCFQFHEAVKSGVLPLVDFIYDRKRQKLGLESLRPWDTEAEPAGVKHLNPFTTGERIGQ